MVTASRNDETTQRMLMWWAVHATDHANKEKHQKWDRNFGKAKQAQLPDDADLVRMRTERLDATLNHESDSSSSTSSSTDSSPASKRCKR